MAIYNKLKSLLFDAGLTEAQVLVYISLLKKPAATIWELVKRTGMHKTTVYDAFLKLQQYQMVEKTGEVIRALSLKAFIAELNRSQRKTAKIAYKIKQIAPFLRLPRESIEELETFYTPDQIADAYLTMAQLPYSVNLDFGDYENFITTISTNELGLKFRNYRSKHASNNALCTTFGPNLAAFCTDEARQQFKNNVEVARTIPFTRRWIVFSDTSDYVLFNDVSDSEFPTSVLIKSKPISDIQRLQFNIFSETIRN